jgi:hypothetical protein
MMFLSRKANYYELTNANLHVKTHTHQTSIKGIVIKRFPINRHHGKRHVEYSYVFAKRSTYRIDVLGQGAQTPEIFILDAKRNEVKVDRLESNKSRVRLDCKTTSIYYIRLVFNSGADFQGECLVSIPQL